MRNMPHLHLTNITLLVTALLLNIAGTLHATPSVSLDADTLPRARQPWIGLATGVGIFGTAAVARQSYPRVWNRHSDKKSPDRGTDWLQYAPLATPWVLKAAGVHTRSGWGRMAVSQGLATILMAGTVKTMKDSFHSSRPDGSDVHSFPSGHTAFAFMGATMLAFELNDVSAWYTVGAYAMATGIALERAIDNHHYPTDIAAGAGIGIFTAQLGYWIGDMIFGRHRPDIPTGDLRPNTNVSFLSLQTGLALPLGHVRAGNTSLQRLPSLSASLRGGWAVSDHWGLALEFGILSTPLLSDVHHDRTYVKSMSSLSALIIPYYVCPLSNCVSFTAEAAVGYRHNLPLNLEDSSIETGTSSPVGRVNAGCVLRFSSNFSARASIGYEISRYRFTVRPSTIYHIPAAASTRGISSALLLNISSRYEF